MSFEVLTKDEAARRARISRRFLDKRIKAGTGPAVFHIGTRALVRSDALQAWLEALTAQQQAVQQVAPGTDTWDAFANGVSSEVQ